MKKKGPKSKMISMRITEEQFSSLNDLAARIKEKTGFRITRASIIMKLMEYGYPALEKDFPKKKKNILESEETKKAG
jgi:hypothetical protein